MPGGKKSCYRASACPDPSPITSRRSGALSHMLIWHAILLGLLEGLTEFLPVSSTGHILLAGHFLGFKSSGKTFEVLIQLGAILAIVCVYFGRLLDLAKAVPYDVKARR